MVSITRFMQYIIGELYICFHTTQLYLPIRNFQQYQQLSEETKTWAIFRIFAWTNALLTSMHNEASSSHVFPALGNALFVTLCLLSLCFKLYLRCPFFAWIFFSLHAKWKRNAVHFARFSLQFAKQINKIFTSFRFVLFRIFSHS
jgi:hypothetical protein